jgi:hypothetical protein
MMLLACSPFVHFPEGTQLNMAQVAQLQATVCASKATKVTRRFCSVSNATMADFEMQS